MAKRRASPGPRTDYVGTDLHRFSTALLEATALAALVVVPLYFNPQTERVFEPDKLAWVLVLGMMALWAHALRAAEGWLTRPSSADRLAADVFARVAKGARLSPLTWAVVLAALALTIGTVGSSVPTVSLWGIYRRGQGLLVYAAYLSLLAAVVVAARRPGAVERLKLAAVVPAVPAALYTLLQRFGVDSVSWDTYGAAAAERAFGPLGNPIFLGAYLIMVLPLAAAGCLTAWGDWRLGKAGAARRGFGHSAVVLLTLAAILAAQSRGPTLGLMASVVLFVLLWAAASGRSRIAVGSLGLAAVALTALIFVGRSGGPGLGRLATLLSPSSRTARERLLVWDALAELATSEPDRILTGYGPDTLTYALPKHLSDELIQLTPTQTFDRAHNVVWEWWVSAGLLGVVALVALYIAAFYTGLRWLGLVPDRSAAMRLAGAVLGGAMVGALFPLAAGRWTYAALGVPLGLVAGVAGYALLVAAGGGRASAIVTGSASSPPIPPPLSPKGGKGSRAVARVVTVARASTSAVSNGDLLVIGVLAALAGHLVEGAVGLPTAAGELLFWLYIGLLLGLSRGDALAPADTAAGAKLSAATATDDAAASGVVDGLAVAAVAHAPLLVPSAAASLAAPALWLLLPATWLAPDLVGRSSDRPAVRTAARLAVLGAFLLLFVGLRGQTGGGAIAFGLFLVGATVALAGGLVDRRPGAIRGALWRWVVYGAMAMLLAVGAWRLTVAPVVADAHIRSGLEAGVAGSIDGARAHFERAVTLWPDQPAYATYLHAAYRDVVIKPEVSTQVRQAAFTAAVDTLTRALERVPDDLITLRLAMLYQVWGDQLAGADRLRAWDQARAYYDRALALAPRSPLTLAEHGAYLERVGATGPARDAYRRAADLDPSAVGAWLGLVRVALGAGDLADAESALDQALALSPGDWGPVSRTISQSEGWPDVATRARQSRVLFLAQTGQRDAAAGLLATLAAEDPRDPVTLQLQEWLDQDQG